MLVAFMGVAHKRVWPAEATKGTLLFGGFIKLIIRMSLQRIALLT